MPRNGVGGCSAGLLHVGGPRVVAEAAARKQNGRSTQPASHRVINTNDDGGRLQVLPSRIDDRHSLRSTRAKTTLSGGLLGRRQQHARHDKARRIRRPLPEKTKTEELSGSTARDRLTGSARIHGGSERQQKRERRPEPRPPEPLACPSEAAQLFFAQQ